MKTGLRAFIVSSERAYVSKHTADEPKLSVMIQWSLLALVILMPFHAFLSVWLGSITRHEAIIQAWKEALLVLTSLAALVLVARDRARLNRLRQPWVLAAGAFALIAAAVTIITRPSLTAVAFGLKTDLEFLLAGAIALLVSTPQFVRRLTTAVLVGAGIVCGYDVLQIFVLPPDFLTHFGYGPHTIAPFQTITQGTNALRFPATLGGPNQLGTYLILPLALSLLLARRRPWTLLLAAAAAISLVATYSRAAWLGALVAVCYLAFLLVPPRLHRQLTFGLGAIMIGGLLLLPIAINHGGTLQYFLLHSSAAAHDQAGRSDVLHVASLKTGISSDLSAPLGHGLGTAGPATFHAGDQNIIENYFLQIGYETGLLGLAAFLGALGLLLWSLTRHARTWPLAAASIAALIGVSITGLVLPSWTDSSTALIAWICAGATAGLSSEGTDV